MGLVGVWGGGGIPLLFYMRLPPPPTTHPTHPPTHRPPPSPPFQSQFLLFEGGEMLCSAVFVSVVRQKKALCVQGFAVSAARKGEGHFFI